MHLFPKTLPPLLIRATIFGLCLFLSMPSKLKFYHRNIELLEEDSGMDYGADRRREMSGTIYRLAVSDENKRGVKKITHRTAG